MSVTRLDNYLVDEKIVESRTKAQAIIKDGLVSVNASIVKKSSFKVDAQKDEVSVEEHKQYVSRSANKLALFLEEINQDFIFEIISFI